MARPGHTIAITEILFSFDGQFIVTSSADTTVKVWNANTGQELLTLTDHTSWVTRLDISLDGTPLVTCSRDGKVRVHLLKIEELITLAKSRVSRSFTKEECHIYLHLEEMTFAVITTKNKSLQPLIKSPLIVTLHENMYDCVHPCPRGFYGDMRKPCIYAPFMHDSVEMITEKRMVFRP